MRQTSPCCLACIPLHAPAVATLPLPTRLPSHHPPAHLHLRSAAIAMGLRQRRLSRLGIFCTPQLLMCPVPRPSAEGRTRPCTRLPFDIVINIASPTSSISDAPRLGSTIMTTTPPRPTRTINDQSLRYAYVRAHQRAHLLQQ